MHVAQIIKRVHRIGLFIIMTAVFSIAGCTSTRVGPPVATIKPHAQTLHGYTWVDNYYWLRERENPKVIDYLKAENKYTQAMTKHTKRLQKKLYKEMKSRIKENDYKVPVKEGDYYYYTKTIKGKQYSVYARKLKSLDAEEEILLDPNKLAKGKKYFRIGRFRVSPDHKLLAYSVDTAGSETYTVFIKNLDNGKLLGDNIPNTYYSLEWGNDNRTLFYNTLDHAKRPYKIFRHILGNKASDDQLVYHEKDESYFVNLSKTRSQGFILMNMKSSITSEVHYLYADRPLSEFQIIAPRIHGVEYEGVEHHGRYFYITTNQNAINFKLMRTPIKTPGAGPWEEVIAHRPDVKLDGVDAFAHHLAIYERENGLKKLRIRQMSDNQEHYVSFPESVYTYRATNNEEFFADTIRYNYTSLVTPNSVFDYNMTTKQSELKKQDEVLGGYDPSRYTTRRIFATAKDGTKVPISLVYKNGLVRDGNNPALLYGYGSYGANMDPRFSSQRLSLLDRGFVYAIAHIRGGGDMGRPWYEDGKFLNKKNTFTDFIACAEHLVAEKFTSPKHLAIRGGSAGGLLMGAVTNMRPDLFNTVLAHVPFVDVITTMLDPTIPLTVIEYEEWGNPNDKAFFDYMLSYSPYDHVEAKNYPNILITAGLNDPRVQYWEPAKWTAKLRKMKTDDNVLVLKTNMGAGHGGSSGRYDRIHEKAFEYAFMLDTLGIKN